MSEENVATVRRIYKAWAKGNFRAGVEVYDPQVVLVQGPGFLIGSGAYLGLDGIRDYMAEYLEAWERVTIEAAEIIEAPDSIVAKVVQRATGRGSGVQPAEMTFFQVWSFRAGRVIRLDVLQDRQGALEAAGLSE